MKIQSFQASRHRLFNSLPKSLKKTFKNILHTGDTKSLDPCEQKHQYFFVEKKVCKQIHESTSRLPLTCGPSMNAIWDNSSFLRFYELDDLCTSTLVKHLPRVDDPFMQSRTTPRFQGSTSWWLSTPVQQSTTCQKNVQMAKDCCTSYGALSYSLKCYA